MINKQKDKVDKRFFATSVKSVVLTALLSLSATSLQAQYNNPIAFEIGGEKITTDDFKAQFLNGMGGTVDASMDVTAKREALNEYADLYLNYLLKLKDAYAMGLDTTPELRHELKRYRHELAAPYLIDSSSMQRLLREAYERNQYALHAYHILIPCSRNASPADTLKAYQRAVEVFDRAVLAAEKFPQVALEISAEELKKDPEAKVLNKKPYNGDLPYFTVFNMVYPFESAAYGMEVGQISSPVRSQYGYHIIYLEDKVPYFGRASLQHIWVSGNADMARAEASIHEAYQQLQDGQQFAVVCRNYSDDRSTSQNGGLMPDMPIDQLPKEYVQKLSTMQEGTYSAPFQTQYGWHILYCVSKEQLPAFEDLVPVYQQRMTRDAERANVSRKVFAQQCMQKYGSQDYTQTYTTVGKGKKAKKIYDADLAETKSYFADTSLRLQWKYVPRDEQHDMRPIFRIGEQKYYNDDLLKFIEGHHNVMVHCDVEGFVNNRFDAFKEYCVVNYADAHLEQDNAEFAELKAEYRNGLMIFAYNDEQVWSKAILDTAGLRQFYAKESAKKQYGRAIDSVYFWNQRARVLKVYIADSVCLERDKALKVLEKLQKKNALDSLTIYNALFKKLDKKCSTERPIQLSTALVEQGNQILLNANEWNVGIYGRNTRTGYQLIVVKELVEPTLKTLVEGRGYYISDYQNVLERELIARLKAKYHVVKHQKAIDEITY